MTYSTKALSLLLFLSLACGCTHTKNADPVTVPCGAPEHAAAGAPSKAEVYALVDLPRTHATHELSGSFFDEPTRTLYAVEDKQPLVVALEASADYRTWRIGPTTVLSGFMEDSWDGEGLARAPGGGSFVVANERAAAVGRFDPRGAFVERVTMPEHYTKARKNKGLEGLALSPDARFLFTVNEEALEPDGPRTTAARGTMVRILRRELATSRDEEFAYRTEPLDHASEGGDMGVSEIAALSDQELLLLERGYRKGYGNTIRIFRVRLAGARDVLNVPSLDDATPVLAKSLVVDVGTLHCAGATNPGPQPNPILENYEAMSLGPTLPDGRRLLFLISDDNGNDDQIARLLVLSLALN